MICFILFLIVKKKKILKFNNIYIMLINISIRSKISKFYKLKFNYKSFIDSIISLYKRKKKNFKYE